jgi:dihydrodipicolinate synthase/N-acetylneuraminate lyase
MERREFLVLGAGALGVRLFAARDSSAKPLRGIFPITQTPFTESDKLDLDALVEELRFIDRGGVHGFVWPQNASEWTTLTEAERLAGAEAIASTGKKLRPAIVIGVQGPTTAAAVKYARHAEKAGADAIISLPPAGQGDAKAVLDYYKEVGNATRLPLFVQAVGDLSVDTIIALYQAVPTLRYVKDEAGQPLMRVAELRARSDDQLKVFTGGHGRTLIDEMIRGFSGSMPAASFADIYAAAWDLWHAGKHKEAVEEFGEAAILINEIGAYGTESLKYILCLRGVFKTYRTREAPATGGAAAQSRAQLDETSKQVLRELLDLMKPYLKA